MEVDARRTTTTTSNARLWGAFRESTTTYLRRHAQALWKIIGAILWSTYLVAMPIVSLNATVRDLLIIGFIFIPCCMVFHVYMLYTWNSPRACRRFTPKTRMVFSCVILNAWAVGCIVAFYAAKSALWIAGWWFVLIPAILLALNSCKVLE